MIRVFTKIGSYAILFEHELKVVIFASDLSALWSEPPVHKFGFFLTLFLFASVAFTGAAFPTVLPRLTNRYYSAIGMKTRIEESDYSKIGTRGACLLLLLIAVGLMIRQALTN
jgi:hypothetical protein